jgi:hypothetical protein
MQNNFWSLYKTYIIEVIVLVFFLAFGLYLYLDYSHRQILQENVVRQDILDEVNEGLKENLNLVKLKEESEMQKSSTTLSSQNQLQKINEEREQARKRQEEKIAFNEEKLFEFLNLESEPKLLDKLMSDLVIKNNSTSTAEDTCQGNNLLEKEECKKSLFIGCAEALYLKFAIVNECVQFEKEDYVNYIKAKRQVVRNLDRSSSAEVFIQTALGEISPSAFTLSREELKDTIDSSIINNDFSKVDFSDLANQSEKVSYKDIEKEIESEQTVSPSQEKKVLNSLLSSLTGVIVKYSGWVQGWATMFAINGGRAEAGFKMYKTTAFGFNPYRTDTCLISLPYKTVDKFFGTNLNYCVRHGLLSCISDDKQKVKGKPIEVFMIKNGKSAVFPLGDLGPSEWTGNAADLNGCAARKLGASGKDQVRFRVAK